MHNYQASTSGRRSRWRREENVIKDENTNVFFKSVNNVIQNKKEKNLSIAQSKTCSSNDVKNDGGNLENDCNFSKNAKSGDKINLVNNQTIKKKKKWESAENRPPLLDAVQVSLVNQKTVDKDGNLLGKEKKDVLSSTFSSSSSVSCSETTPHIAVSFANKFAMKALKSNIAMCNSTLFLDIQKALDGGTIYVPNFFCAENDFRIFHQLEDDIKNEEKKKLQEILRYGGTHLKLENPEFSEIFTSILKQMADYFDVEIYARRLNYYRSENDFKPFHHDSHVFFKKNQKSDFSNENHDEQSQRLVEDFTMGASFGASRQLVFLHEPSGQQFAFPQNNGDIFAFNSHVNKSFKHGVPKEYNQAQKVCNNNKDNNLPLKKRFSVIAWGRRRNLCFKNAARSEIKF